MKTILSFILLAFHGGLYAQPSKVTKAEVTDTTKAVSLITIFDETAMACKEGYLIDGYVVNISFNQARILDGKKIKITGYYTIVQGLESKPKEYDKKGNIIHSQGRFKDTKHLESPAIDLIE